MAEIGFIGVGNMGGPMAANLVTAGHAVKAFDLSQDAVAKAVEGGATAVGSAAEAAFDSDIVITMLPAGTHVRGVYENEVIGHGRAGALFIDCSTIDVETSRAVHDLAAGAGFAMVDAPVSGGIMGAAAGTLTFMCGGTDEAFATSPTDPGSDGQEHHPCRGGWKRSGGQDLQQHDAWHPNDLGL